MSTGPAGPAPGLRVADVPWPAVEARLAAGAVAVLPIGAASKEHGRHLPLATDYLQAEWLAGRLIAHLPVVVWPTLSYGYYPVFVDYPGSSSLARETFAAVVGDVLAGCERAGARIIAVLNTGISTIAPLEEVIAARAGGAPVQLVNCYEGPAFSAARAAVETQAFGGHADEIETALMLALAPERVDMTAAEAQPAPIERGVFNRRDPGAPNYSPSGVNGDPTRATPAKGARLAEALYADVAAAVGALAGEGRP